MNSTAFTLILISAGIHATWNFLLRKHTGNIFILWTGLLIPGVLVTGWSLASGSLIFSTEGLEYLFASGVVHAVYFYLLSVCYSQGEISLVYPISRGSAVGSACLMAWFLIEEEVSGAGYTGIALVLLGVFVIKGLKTKGNLTCALQWRFFSCCRNLLDPCCC